MTARTRTAPGSQLAAQPRPRRPQEKPPRVENPSRVEESAPWAENLVATVARLSARAASTAEVARHPEAVVREVQKLAQAAPLVRDAVRPLLTGQVEDWREEYAYTLGVQAFVYGFPYIHNAQLRHAWVTRPRNPTFVPYAAVNHFWHASQVMDATYRDGGCPNNDALYSSAWVDLRAEPVILSHPDMGDWYFTLELMGITSDNFDYVGQRPTGSNAGHFALVGPGWAGQLPTGVQASLQPAPSPWILVLGRTLVDGDADVPNVRALQQQYKLTPLSLWGRPQARVPERRDVLKPVEVAEDVLGPWKS